MGVHNAFNLETHHGAAIGLEHLHVCGTTTGIPNTLLVVIIPNEYSGLGLGSRPERKLGAGAASTARAEELRRTRSSWRRRGLLSAPPLLKWPGWVSGHARVLYATRPGNAKKISVGHVPST